MACAVIALRLALLELGLISGKDFELAVLLDDELAVLLDDEEVILAELGLRIISTFAIEPGRAASMAFGGAAVARVLTSSFDFISSNICRSLKSLAITNIHKFAAMVAMPMLIINSRYLLPLARGNLFKGE
jgi:hypothetical protein